MKDQLVTKKILNWYDLNRRSLPWRKNVSFKKKQYFTLISEFMLQQTQVVTVIPYFNRFIKEVPNLISLSKIPNSYACNMSMVPPKLTQHVRDRSPRRAQSIPTPLITRYGL